MCFVVIELPGLVPYPRETAKKNKKIDHGERPEIYHGLHLPAVLSGSRRIAGGRI